MRAFVYFNLHRKVWSVKALEGPNKGRVIDHADWLQMTDCTFKVSEAGRQRVLRENRKNVHAGVVGTLVDDVEAHASTGRAISYNPRKAGHFYDRETGERVERASLGTLNAATRGVIAQA